MPPKTTKKKPAVKKTVTAQAAPKKATPAVTAPVVSVKGQKPVKSYKGLCILMIVFLYLEFFGLLFIQMNYDVTLDPKRPSYATQLRRHRMANKRPLSKVQKERPAHHRSTQKGRPMAHVQDHRTAAMPIKAQPAPAPQVKCPEPVARKATFNEAQYAPYQKGGKAKIQGKACFALNDGSEKCFPNLPIFINPVTDYSDEWYARGWEGTEYLAEADSRALPYNKQAQAAQDGVFVFENLAPGSYYVVTQLCVPTGKDAKSCEYRRYGAKVSMKNMVKPTLKQIFPKAK